MMTSILIYLVSSEIRIIIKLMHTLVIYSPCKSPVYSQLCITILCWHLNYIGKNSIQLKKNENHLHSKTESFFWAFYAWTIFAQSAKNNIRQFKKTIPHSRAKTLNCRVAHICVMDVRKYGLNAGRGVIREIKKKYSKRSTLNECFLDYEGKLSRKWGSRRRC